MARTINFVRERRRQLKSISDRDRKILQQTVIVFVGVILLSVLALAVNFWSKQQLNNVVKQQQATRNAIASQSAQELQYDIFIEKLKVIKELFRQRQGKKEALKFFRNLFEGDKVKISGLEFDDADKELTFSIKSTSVFSLNQVVDVLASDEVKTKYPQIEKHGIRRDPLGAYTVQISVKLDHLLAGAEGSKE